MRGSYRSNRFNHDALLQSSPCTSQQAAAKMTFLAFPRYSSYSMWVRWANLQPSNVKFLQDSVCQKRIKSVHFRRSYSKNKNVSVFWGHSVLLSVLARGLQKRGGQFAGFVDVRLGPLSPTHNNTTTRARHVVNVFRRSDSFHHNGVLDHFLSLKLV